MADDKIDRVIMEFFAALKELGELRYRYDSTVENVRQECTPIAILCASFNL